MRSFIDAVQPLTEQQLSSGETKFWYSARQNRFIDHDIDTHHTKVLASDPEDFGLSHDSVAHHPHAGADVPFGYDEFDREPEDDEFADNDDMGMFAQAFDLGWVRGGHMIDVMAYHEWDEIRPDDEIYLQGEAGRDLQRCVRACLKRWPFVQKFSIETGQRFFRLADEAAIRAFARNGVVPN